MIEEITMIDTHLHILPGIDDGPETVEESLALARVLVKEGFHSAIPTPHYNDDFQRLSPSEFQPRFFDFKHTLNRFGIPLILFAGHEALIYPLLLDIFN